MRNKKIIRIVALLGILILSFQVHAQYRKHFGPRPKFHPPDNEWIFEVHDPEHVAHTYYTPRIDEGAFDALEYGMSFKDCEKIIGFPGEPYQKGLYGDTPTAFYIWYNYNNSGLYCRFYDNKLINKTKIVM